MISQTVRERFYVTNAPFEGAIPFLYADRKGLPTIAVGVLCRTVESAQVLPLRRADGTLATRDEIAADWRAVNKNAEAADKGHTFAATLVKLRLTPDDCRALVMRRFDSMVVELHRRYPALSSWPATAQMAVCCWAWAPGAWSPAPRMDAALAVKDFNGASKESWLNETNNRGLHPRNLLNRALLRRAAITAATGGDYDSLVTQPEDFADAPPPPQGMSNEERARTLALVASTIAASVSAAIETGREEREP